MHRRPDRAASQREALLVLIYTARFISLEHATIAAEIISGDADWLKYGGDEIAVLDFRDPTNSPLDPHLWWLCDLSEIPEARDIAVAIYKKGKLIISETQD